MRHDDRAPLHLSLPLTRLARALGLAAVASLSLAACAVDSEAETEIVAGDESQLVAAVAGHEIVVRTRIFDSSSRSARLKLTRVEADRIEGTLLLAAPAGFQWSTPFVHAPYRFTLHRIATPNDPFAKDPLPAGTVTYEGTSDFGKIVTLHDFDATATRTGYAADLRVSLTRPFTGKRPAPELALEGYWPTVPCATKCSPDGTARQMCRLDGTLRSNAWCGYHTVCEEERGDCNPTHCQPGWEDRDGDPKNGCEYKLCPAGQDSCGSMVCFDLAKESRHCGACGNKCAVSAQWGYGLCRQGACVP